MLGMNPLSTGMYATKRRRRNGKSSTSKEEPNLSGYRSEWSKDTDLLVSRSRHRKSVDRSSSPSSLKPPPKDGVTKSNPSKRHRERLNAELDTLANLLPFEQNILSKLDRLSILRLSVSYLRTKSYFQDTMHSLKEESGQYRPRSELSMYEHSTIDGDMFLQALNGFLVILTCEGEVFFATHTIESYLGFHQSDIVHQSVYELVHSEDREELQKQLMWNSFLPAEHSSITLQEAILPENSHLLERNFTVRFRCLLDNTSGFLRLDIRGRVKVLHGQYRKTEEPPLALFAICTPFGPPSLLEIPHKEVMFKSKHKLDLSLVSMDQRGKGLLGYSDNELANMGGYDLVHFDDLAYVASAHAELLKTGASGMIAYRYQTKEGSWQWLQTSSRLVYKNSKPDFVICTHRPLMEEEGRDLVGKRTMDFKVSYLDAGLTNSYFSDSDQLVNNVASSNQYSSVGVAAATGVAAGSTSLSQSPTKSPTPQRVNRRYKTQLRDFLSTCRTKRKLNSLHQPPIAHPTPTNPTVDYMAVAGPGTDPAAAAVAAVAYSNLNSMYPSTYATPAPMPMSVPNAANDNTGLSGFMSHSSNFHQSLYDNRLPYLSATDNLFHQYRPLGNYYTDYHSAMTATASPYVSANGFLDIQSRASPSNLPTYDTTASHHHAVVHENKLEDCDKIYSCASSVSDSVNVSGQPLLETKYAVGATTTVAERYVDNKSEITTTPSYMSCDVSGNRNINRVKSLDHGISGGGGDGSGNGVSSTESSSSSSSVTVNGLIASKLDNIKTEVLQHYSPLQVTEPPRQTVLMWALNHTPQTTSSSGRSPTDGTSSNASTPPMLMNGSSSYLAAPIPRDVTVLMKKTSYSAPNDPLKSLAEMNTMSVKWEPDTPPSPKSYYHHHYHQYGGSAIDTSNAEVWPPAHHQFYPYHHHHTAVARSGVVAECAYPQINRTGVLCCPSRR